MNEGFDLNKKSVPGESYRKNLAEELKILTPEEAQEKLLTEQNEKEENRYEEEKIEQRALWIVDKYFSEPDMFKMDDSFSLEQRQEKIDEIFNQKIEELNAEEKGVVDALKEKTYALASRTIKERDIENNPNLEHVKGKYLDLVLQKTGEDGKTNNKFLEIEVRDNDLDRNIFEDLAVDMQFIKWNSPKEARYFMKKENEEKILPRLNKFILETFKDEKDQVKFVLDSVFRSKSETMIITRPMTKKIFDQHYEILNEFRREHKNYQEDKYFFGDSYYKEEDTSNLFGEEKKGGLKDFAEAVLEIIKNEIDYKIAFEKIKNLPKPKGLHPTFSVRGGGYIEKDDKGIFCPGRTSQGFGPFDKGLVDYAFQKNFGKKGGINLAVEDKDIELSFL